MIPRYFGNLFLFNLTTGFITVHKTFRIITPALQWVHSWVLSTFTAFTSEGASNIWHRSVILDALCASKGCRRLCIHV